MINFSRDIHPLTAFLRNTNDFTNRMKKTRQPVILILNGKAEVVVQDAKSYQKSLDRMQRLELLEAIRVGIAGCRGRPAAPARVAPWRSFRRSLVFQVDITTPALSDPEDYVRFIREV